MTDPTVLVIEDTHWMDEASRELLGGLLTGLSDIPGYDPDPSTGHRRIHRSRAART